MKIINRVVAGIMLAVVVALPGGAGATDDSRPALPENKTIDTLFIKFQPKMFGSASSLGISKDGKVTYSYQSEPHTGSGGKTIQKEWKIEEVERVTLLSNLLEDGLLDLDDKGVVKFPNHYIAVSYGRWQFSMHPKEFPDKMLKRLLPLLQHAHPEEWGPALDK